MNKMQLPEEIFDFIVLRQLINSQFVNLHAGLLVWLIACDASSKYLQGATQLTNSPHYAVLFVLN